jgi:hypothetical protein
MERFQQFSTPLPMGLAAMAAAQITPRDLVLEPSAGTGLLAILGWASKAAAIETKDREPKWLKQVWFPGCHSDIGGSYPEAESRLSDIALDWMVGELKECVPSIRINENFLNRAPDPLGLQHREDAMVAFGPFRIGWKKGIREVGNDFPLHPSVQERMQASAVAQCGEVKPYRPAQLKERSDLKCYYEE